MPRIHRRSVNMVLTQPDNQHQIAVLRWAQRKYPDDYWINFKLAYTLDYVPPPVQDQDEAIRFYTAAISCRPRNAPAHYYIAHVLHQRGRVAEAIAQYQKAIELNPDFTWPRAGLCAVYHEQGKLVLAIAECQRAIDRNANDAEAHDLLARVLGQCGRIGESIHEYETAITLKPNVVTYQNNLAWTLVTCPEKELRNLRRGLELAKRAVEFAKERASCWNTLGVALYRTGDWNGAIAALEKSIALQGFSGYDGFFLAMARAPLGQPDNARNEYDRALRWMKKVKSKDDELRRFRAEAAELLRIDERSPVAPN
jgi:tetratricopeptide (TPR) repeat protein